MAQTLKNRVRQWEKKYKSRIASRSKNKDSICVGGAVCLEANCKPSTFWTYRFPPVSEIAKGLTLLNPHLLSNIATQFALAIVRENRQKQFHEAWKVVLTALR